MSEEKNDLKKEAGDGQPVEDKIQEPSAEQPVKKEDGETVESLKEQLAKEKETREKAESDRDNYKTGLLSAKAKKISLSPEFEKKPEVNSDEYEGLDEDEKKAVKQQEQIAKKQTETILYEQNRKAVLQNEQMAIRKFMQKFPETAEKVLMDEIVENYSNKHGKSVEAVQEDMERAYNLVKIDRNIPITTDKTENKTEAELASVPTGGGGINNSLPLESSFDTEAISAMKELGIEDATAEKLAELKKRIDSGQLKLPENVIDKLFKNQ